MPNIDVISPVSSAPIDRLALGLGWVRPGAAHIGGSLSLSSPGVAGIGLKVAAAEAICALRATKNSSVPRH